MRNIYRFMMAAFAATAAMTACQQENLEPEVQENKTVQVKVTIGDQVKGFTDLEGMTWEVGDQIKYAGGLEVVSEALKAENISDDGYSATFTFPASLTEGNRTGWFVSTKCHPGNYNEVEFTLGQASGNVYTQDKAGEMNKRYLFLHSGTGITNITAGEVPEITMDVVGTIFRVIPYTGDYGNESVLSVRIESNTDLVGTVAYDRGAGTYRGVNDINWQKSKSVTVNLAEAFSLEGVTSADDSKGVYIAVAATKEGAPLNGYKYIVETDKALYTFDAMDKQLPVGENIVKNVPLNLDKGSRYCEGGELQYLGNLDAAVTALLAADGITGFDGGYWYAQIKADGSEEWVNKDGAENVRFYDHVEFTITDAVSGEPVDWLTVSYGGNGGTHWMISAKANDGAERAAVVTATFSDVKGYVVTDECRTKTITIRQSASGTAKIVTVRSQSVRDWEMEGKAQKDVNVGYCLLGIDGVDNRDWSGDVYSRIQFKCVSEEDHAAGNYENTLDWLSCVYQNNNGVMTDCTWWVSLTENTTGAERVGYVVAVYPDDDGYEFPEPTAIKITQKANTLIAVSLTDVYAETIPAAGGVVTAVVVTLTVDGVQASDVAAAMNQYGVTLSVNNGASATVATDGTVTMFVPENPYRNGGKEYTLDVRRDGAVLASVVVNQAEGDNEDVPVIPSFTWEFGAWQKGHNGNYAVQFDAAGFDTRHWLVVFGNLKKDGETPAVMEDTDTRYLVMQMLNLTEEEYAAQPFNFILEFGGAGESKLLISIKEANTTGQMIVYEGDVYEADHSAIINHYTVNHLP